MVKIIEKTINGKNLMIGNTFVKVDFDLLKEISTVINCHICDNCEADQDECFSCENGDNFDQL